MNNIQNGTFLPNLIRNYQNAYDFFLAISEGDLPEYRGEQFDASLGLYYLCARYYVPRTGRFLTADKYEGNDVHSCDCPLQTPRVNINQVFGYANADPVGMIDPSGRGPLLDSFIILQAAAYVAIGIVYLSLKLAPDILHFLACADAWVTGDPDAQTVCTLWPLINQN